MFEELITQLDEYGVPYTEDYDIGTLTIDIAAVDKSILIDIIIMLHDAGYNFSITDTSITVEESVVSDTEDTYDEEAYLDDAIPM